MSNDHNPHQYSTTPYQYSSAQQSQATNYPSPSPYKQSSEMATMPQPPAHTQQDLYRPHNSYDMYQNPPPQMSYPPPGSQQGQGQPQVSFNQPAPRQRTAIACRYCRRRKVSVSQIQELGAQAKSAYRFAVMDSIHPLMEDARIV